MGKIKELSIGYSRISDDSHALIMESESLPDITIDWGGIPRDQRGGNSIRLLAAACLNCFAGTFADAMKARGAEIISLTGQADIHTVKEERGCLVTYSLENAFPVSYAVERKMVDENPNKNYHD